MTNDVEEMINKYFDEELTKSQEIILFSTLSQDAEAIEYFKRMNLLRNSVEKTKEEYPPALDEKILFSLSMKEGKSNLSSGQRILLAGSYALALILFIISAFLFNSLNNYKQEIDYAVKTIETKSQMIDIILNSSLPPAEVKAAGFEQINVKAN